MSLSTPPLSQTGPDNRETAAAISRAWLWAGLLFLAALLPRLYALGAFLTIDEVKWAEGAAQFLGGLANGHFFQTYWHFHPGITITWGEALLLWIRCATASDLTICAEMQVENLPETIGWLRLSPVLLTSLGTAGAYLLLRRLFNHSLALLTALLLAFDPFFIAHSRILNGDALAAILMFLSLLAFLIYRQKPSGYTYLIISGMCAGLALLTKLPAPLIGPFVGGLGLLAITSERQQGWPLIRRRLLDLLLWGGLALLTFVLLWPAMWVAPLATLRQMYIDTFEVGEVGAGHEAFFLGHIVTDPGPWFYPYAIAFRLTPVVTLGLLAGLIWLIYQISRTRHFSFPGLTHTPLNPPESGGTLTPPPQRGRLGGGSVKKRRKSRFQDSTLLRPTMMLVMLAYVIFIILFSNISPKKLDRYVMAVIPALIFLAAVGFQGLWSTLRRRFPETSGQGGQLLLIGAVGLQLLFAVLAAPYYLGYYNPLLGGPRRAAAQVPVGWGEGLEQAASYLNQQPEAERLTVSGWYSDIFQPYFVGQRASFSDDGRSQLAADYVVFYINQIQRQKPYPGLVDYFRAQPPVFALAVQPTGQLVAADDPTGEAVHWVEVYRAPAAQSAGGAPKIEGVAQLLAYKVTPAEQATHQTSLSGGQTVTVTLFMKVLGPLPEETTFAVALADVGTNQRWGDWDFTEMQGTWAVGNLIEWHGQLTLLEAMPPGDYRFWLAFRFQEGETIADVPISEKDPLFQVQ